MGKTLLVKLLHKVEGIFLEVIDVHIGRYHATGYEIVAVALSTKWKLFHITDGHLPYFHLFFDRGQNNKLRVKLLNV